ncbi:MAG: MAPEG family protein [Boseongicola sp.]
MTKREKILVGMAIGALWALAVVALPSLVPSSVFVPLNVAIIVGLLPGGLFLLLVIGRLAQRRFFDDDIIDGEPFVAGSDADIDQRVLTNTIEQLVLAVVTWPFVGVVLGGVAVIALGIGFGIARMAFWIGYHQSPPLRAFGFAASFYPTIAASVWSVLVWFV